jgi:hypothetical protein
MTTQQAQFIRRIQELEETSYRNNQFLFTDFLNEAQNTPEIVIFFPLIFGKKGKEDAIIDKAESHEQSIKKVFGTLDKFKKKVSETTYDKVIALLNKSNCKVVTDIDYTQEQINKFKEWMKKSYPWCVDYIFVKGTMTNIKKISLTIAPFMAKVNIDMLGTNTRRILPTELVITQIKNDVPKAETSKKKEPSTKPKKPSLPKKDEVKQKPFKVWNTFIAREFIDYIQDKLSLSSRYVESSINGKELTTQYMCKWKNPSDEEDYDWKDLSAASHKAIKSAIAFFNKKYGVTIAYYPQEKEYIIYEVK